MQAVFDNGEYDTQDCLWMTGTILLALFNSLLYCACTSLIR